MINNFPITLPSSFPYLCTCHVPNPAAPTQIEEKKRIPGRFPEDGLDELDGVAVDKNRLSFRDSPGNTDRMFSKFSCKKEEIVDLGFSV
jgi:hypothetical protein